MFKRMAAASAAGLFLATLCLIICPRTTAAGQADDDESQPQVLPVEQQVPEIGEAAKRFQARDFTGAKEILDEAVKKRPELPPAALLMVRFFAQANERNAVESWLQETVREAPNDPEAYVILADLDSQERRWAQADAMYRKAKAKLEALEDSPRKAEITVRALIGMAAMAEVRGELELAQKTLETVLQSKPEHAGALQQLARVFFRQDNPDEALSKLRAAAEIDEDLLTPEAILAQLYEQSGDRDNARRWMSAAITVKPRDLNTRLAAAQWAMGAGLMDEAERWATEALRLKGDSLDAQILCGMVAMFQENYPEAVKSFQKAYLQSPSNFAATNYLALAMAHTGDPDRHQRAFQFAENNVRKNTDVPEAYSTLGWSLYRLGRLDDAEKAFNTAVSVGQLRADMAYYWARLKADRGETEAALQLLESALGTSAPFFMREEAEDLMERLKPGTQR